jgi:tol-pal system protein YbgF
MMQRRRSRNERGARAALLAAAVATSAWAVSGCYPPQVLTMASGVDSIQVAVDSLAARDSMAFRMLGEIRREVAEQRDILLSTRASTGSTTQELFQQMERLQQKLDEVMGRFNQLPSRAETPAGPGPGATAPPPGGDAAQLYDQASQDLTQGRYALALQNFREYLRRVPGGELSDNAQYGVAESFYAQSRFDSAAVEYARVEAQHPTGDKVPAALYKLALSQEKLGQAAPAKQTLETLVRRFPLAGEAQLARERLGTAQRR